MSMGTNIRNQVNSAVFENTNIRSSCTITPYTRTIGSYGGYEDVTETAGTAASVYCVPASYFSFDGGEESVGFANEGSIALIVPYDTTVDEYSSVTFDSQTYNIDRVKRIYFNDVVIAIKLFLGRKP